MPTAIVSGALANKPFNGGAAWTRLSWALGLRRLGFRVCFVEQIDPATCVDASGAPAFNCDVRHFVGHLSADQTTMTFLVDGSADVSDGVLSLAIVPQHSSEIPEAGTDPGTGTDLTPPFRIDFDKPGANEFTAEDSGGAADSGSGGTDSSSTTPPPTTTGSSSSGGGTTAPAAAPAAGSINVPPATGTDPAAGQSPVVAGQQPTSTTPAAGSGVAPAAAVAPAKSDNSKHDLLLVLLVLILFGILYTQNGAQRAPRAAASAPRRADGDATTLPVPYPPGFGVPGRGLGRFNKPRVGNARPLI